MDLTQSATPKGLGSRLSDTSRSDLERTSVGLSEALSSSDEWVRLQIALDALGGDDFRQLRRARSKLCEVLRDANVTRLAGNTLLRRGTFRQTVVEQELEILDDRAAEYARAFQAAEELLNVVLAVAGQFAAYGPAVELSETSGLCFEAGPPHTLSFAMCHPPLLELCQIVTLDDLLADQLLFVQSLKLSFRQTDPLRQRATALVLDSAR